MRLEQSVPALTRRATNSRSNAESGLSEQLLQKRQPVLGETILAGFHVAPETHCAREFLPYRQRYNLERPHDSLGGDTPATRYRPSVRAAPSALPDLEYPSMEIRVVHDNGTLTFHNQTWLIGRAFASRPICVRPTPQAEGQWEVFFSFFKIGSLDFTAGSSSKYVTRPLSSCTSPLD